MQDAGKINTEGIEGNNYRFLGAKIHRDFRKTYCF